MVSWSIERKLQINIDFSDHLPKHYGILPLEAVTVPKLQWSLFAAIGRHSYLWPKVTRIYESEVPAKHGTSGHTSHNWCCCCFIEGISTVYHLTYYVIVFWSHILNFVILDCYILPWLMSQHSWSNSISYMQPLHVACKWFHKWLHYMITPLTKLILDLVTQ